MKGFFYCVFFSVVVAFDGSRYEVNDGKLDEIPFPPLNYYCMHAEPLSSWREIKQGSIGHVEGDYPGSDKNVREVKVKWELSDEEDDYSETEDDKKTIETLLEKWKSVDERIIDNEKHSVAGLKEKWDEEEPSSRNENANKFRLDDMESHPYPPTQPPVHSSNNADQDDLQNDPPQGNLLTHLKEIASSQAKIIHLLKRIEEKYRKDKQCLFNVESIHQQSVLDELDTLSLDKAAYALG